MKSINGGLLGMPVLKGFRTLLDAYPTDMRKGRNGLACIVREVLHRDPLDYGAAFIFYSKRYDMVKILHWDLNGYTMLVKWFEDGKLLKPVFMKAQSCHQIDREQLILLLSTSVQTKIIL